MAWLELLGFDAAFDYHDGAVGDLLAAAAPEGVDVVCDNVGGEHLEAAVGALRLHGRADEPATRPTDDGPPPF